MADERIQKVLGRTGRLQSRRAAEQLILQGRVKLNGQARGRLGDKMDT